MACGALDVETENEIYDLYTLFGARCVALMKIYKTVKVKDSADIMSIVKSALAASGLQFTPTITSSGENSIDITLTPNKVVNAPNTLAAAPTTATPAALPTAAPVITIKPKRGRKKKEPAVVA